MLQKSKGVGFAFLVGMGLNSPIMFFGSTIAVISSLLIAHLFKYDRIFINNGIYGFNAALAGAAVFLFLPVNFLSIILVFIIGATTTVVMHMMLYKLEKLPIFTLPFIISTWLLLLIISSIGIETLTLAFPSSDSVNALYYIVLRGVGQVVFQDYWLSGAVFIIGLFLFSYKLAIWAVIGSLMGIIVARVLSFPEDLAYQGLYSFNATLTAIALAQKFNVMSCISQLNNKAMPIFIGIVLSVLLTRLFELLPFPGLTAPFVLASWIIISLAKPNQPKNKT